MPHATAAEPGSTTINHARAPHGDWNFAALVGVRTHQALAEVLRSGDAMTRDEIAEVVAGLTQRDELVRTLRAAYAGVVTGVHAYLTRYRPAAPWRFVDAEVDLDGAIADYVWVDETSQDQAATRYLVDELKCVTSIRALTTQRNLDQYHRLLACGRARWGERFAGLRIVAPAVGVCHYVQDPVELLLLRTGPAFGDAG